MGMVIKVGAQKERKGVRDFSAVKRRENRKKIKLDMESRTGGKKNRGG